MLRPRLLVIDPSIVYPETEGTATIVAGWGGDVDVRLPSLRPGDGPGPGFGYDYDGVVLMGSKASVEDDHAWLRELSAWLDPILDGREALPLFGICFGHQLIAHRAGGSVGHVRPDRKILLGEETSVLEGGRLIPGRTELRVVSSHCEEVKDLPPGYRVTARRNGIPVDGLEHERLPVFGFQFHPEARGDFLGSRGARPECVCAEAAADGDRLMRAFFDLVRRTAPRVDSRRG